MVKIFVSTLEMPMFASLESPTIPRVGEILMLGNSGNFKVLHVSYKFESGQNTLSCVSLITERVKYVED